LLADTKAYDTDVIIAAVEAQRIKVVISPKKNRKVQRDYDKELYRKRHLVKSAFCELKRWGGLGKC
jgi:transposase